MWALFFQISTSANLVFSTEDHADGFAIGNVLLFENARGKTVLVVVGKHRNRTLQDDDSVIKIFIDKVNRASAHLDSVFESLPLRVQTGKCRKKRGMDV